MNRSSLTVSIAVAILSIGGTALAVPEATAGAALPARVVRFDDLNLGQPRGVAMLYGRIQAAAAQVCGDAQRVGSRIVSTAWQVCVAKAVDRAVAQVDRPALTAYHEARTGAPSLIRTAAVAQPNGRN
jgi:UrcA family protein